MTTTARDEAYVLARSEALSRVWLRNLMRAQRVLVLDPTERVGTALVVGAGPSLDVEAVRSAQSAGASVWTVNTALPALAAAGIVPDVCVTRELVDVSSHMRHAYGVLVADIGARPESVPDQALWVVPKNDCLFDVARAIGYAALDCGPSAVTMAIALAGQYVQRVELHGVDCCYAADGATYHSRSAFGHRHAHWTDYGDRVSYAGPGHDAKREQHASSGMTAPLERETVHQVSRRIPDGTNLYATGDLIEQRQWMEAFAERMRLELTLVDASDGARKAWWDDVETAGTRPVGVVMIGAEAVDDDARAALRAAVLREAEYLATVAINVAHPDGDPGAVPPIASGITRALCAADMLRIRRSGASLREQLRAQYATWARAADEVARTLGATLTAGADYERATVLAREKPVQSSALVSLAVALRRASEAEQSDAARVAYDTASDAVANVVQRALLHDTVVT